MEIVKKDHRISKAAAVAMTKRYRQEKQKIIAPSFKHESILPICETFDRAGFDELLAQKSCVGVRAYYAMNEQDQVHLVFVGVDAQGRDILPASEDTIARLATQESAEDDGVLLDNGARCPENCPEPSPLNS
ncbi:hypothetical protein [Pseudocnuella soli]|uniref:hypothetical protein n=1 Tax=Pseudocnuella soli TaxID=2502779 RepID=UPI00104D46E5|nr:hypothetical protein [Pseudocnuella soli]